MAQILKIVNSAYYSFPREIVEIQFAVAYLGINEIYRIVLSLSVINTLDLNHSVDFKKIWIHSNYTALAAKYLTDRIAPYLPAEKIWSAAILHDIGKLVYLKFFPDHFRMIMHHCETEGTLFSRVEKMLSLPSSAFLGKLLCDRWRLPSRIRDACQHHTLEDLSSISGDSAENDFIRMIIVGNLMAAMAENKLQKTLIVEIQTAVQEALHQTPDEFNMLMEDIVEFRDRVYKLAL